MQTQYHTLSEISFEVPVLFATNFFGEFKNIEGYVEIDLENSNFYQQNYITNPQTGSSLEKIDRTSELYTSYDTSPNKQWRGQVAEKAGLPPVYIKGNQGHDEMNVHIPSHCSDYSVNGC